LKRANAVKISPPRPSRENPAVLAQTYPRTYPVSQCKITLTEDYRIFYFNRTESLKDIIHDFFGKRQVIHYVSLFFPQNSGIICGKVYAESYPNSRIASKKPAP
jgi:hypothetical protein